MKISKNSWHYRLIRKLEWSASPTLCGYFWEIIGAIVAISLFFVVGVVLSAITYLICPLFGYYPEKFIFPALPSLKTTMPPGDLAPRKSLLWFKSTPVYGYQLLFVISAIYFIAILGQGLWLKLIGVVLGIIMIFFLFWFLYIIFSKARRSESWNMFKEYIKAIKDRVCPLNEYID